MKKWMTLLLCCVLALNLTACGAGASGGLEDNAPPQASALHFEVATQVYENEYKADDGTVLLAERYELPVLELRTEDGELYAGGERDGERRHGQPRAVHGAERLQHRDEQRARGS